MRFDRIASNDSVPAYGVYETGPDRGFFAVTDRAHRLWLIESGKLTVTHRWLLTPDAIGSHGILPEQRVAIVSGLQYVSVIDKDGRLIWRHRHPSWQHGDYEAGAAWFDHNGKAFAVVPTTTHDACEIVVLAARDGSITHRHRIATAPAGIQPLHQPGGWVGLSVGEGQEATKAWWVRLQEDELQVVDAGWNDEVLFDVDSTGSRIITTPHVEGPLKIRSFPDLQVVQEIAPPEGYVWDYYACFVGSRIVARAHDDHGGDTEILVAVGADGHPTPLARTESPIAPGPEGSWISTWPNGIQRWRLRS